MTANLGHGGPVGLLGCRLLTYGMLKTQRGLTMSGDTMDGTHPAIQHLTTHGESRAIARYDADDVHHGWNHQQCYPCWFAAWGLDRIPVRYEHGRDPEPCCFCGRPTASGIFIRVRPGSGTIPYCPDPGLDRGVFWDPVRPTRSAEPPTGPPGSGAGSSRS